MGSGYLFVFVCGFVDMIGVYVLLVFECSDIDLVVWDLMVEVEWLC